jgi:hypothetical protein
VLVRIAAGGRRGSRAGNSVRLVPTIKFNIGEAFPADDEVARFVTVLAMMSNDTNRAMAELVRLEDEKEPDLDAGARKMMFFRLQIALFYEAALFISNTRRHSTDVAHFLAKLPSDAQSDCEIVTGGIDPKSSHFVGQWLEDHRNVTFHYSKVHPHAAAHDDEDAARALKQAAPLDGYVFVGDERALGSVRFWFADEITRQWLPDDTDIAPIVALRNATLALVRFTQRAFGAYRATRPSKTFVDIP